MYAGAAGRDIRADNLQHAPSDNTQAVRTVKKIKIKTEGH